MPIDPRIALGYQPPQLESPVNMMMMAQKMQAGQQENQLRQAQMENYQAEVTRRNALLPYDIAKARGDADTAALTRRKTAGEIAAKKTEMYMGLLPNFASSPDALSQWLTMQHNDPDMAGTPIYDQPLDELLAKIPRDSQGFATHVQQTALGIGNWLKENKPTLQSQDLGGSTRMLSIPVLGGAATVVPGSVANKTAAPRAPMTAKEMADRDEAKTVVAREVTDNAGNVRFFNKFGNEIKPEAGKGAGKPTATYEKTKALRAQLARDTDVAIAELTEVSKDGGLIDQSTGSGAGRMVDATAGFFGAETKGDLAIARLEPIADKILKMVPRFEGPQSDKDTQSYKEAAGLLADPTRTTARRKAAAQEILRLMKIYKGQFVTPEMAAEGAGPTAPAAGGVDASNPLLK